ncbi:MAG: ADP-forming succinate--CoA ligase subunit beta [Chlamydiia bacterium]|nr:ADP-forming succinate--CoA ligase subunit beta [Chlamydiia bacterium]
MNVHEYQAKEILQRYGVPVPEFAVVSQVEELKRAVDLLQLSQAVLKIQVHAGGRGKAGGVQFAKTKEEILQKGKALLGFKLVNAQTGPEGVIAHKILVGKPIDIAKEYYVGALIDRTQGVPLLIVSPEGGMEIEEIAVKYPEKILKVPISFDGKVRSYQLVQICKFMGWKGEEAKEGAKVIQGLARCFIEKDASLLEINPLVKTKEGKIVALDAKLAIDDNALFRQQEIAKMMDLTQISPQEASAKEHDLAYIAMEGNIGCMVNGAGLAMATMDIIKLFGGTPANFLDVGGSATKEKVAEGFQIILSDPKVKAIFVNIFGGIMNCATIAHGVLHAAAKLKVQIPLIVRLEGTHAEEGRKVFQESGMKILSAKTLQEGAELAVQSAKGEGRGHLD